MTVLFRCRVDDRILAKADAVTKEIGTKTPEVIRMFLHQIAKTGKVPISLSAGSGELLDKDRRNEVLRNLDDSEGW